MKLEEGMYVRYVRGAINGYVLPKIAKIIDCSDNELIKIDKNSQVILRNDVVKASHTLTDLIEVGDYVNGSKVLDISEDENNRIWIYTDSKNNECCFSESEIEDVVTKEQFNSQKYVVGEIND
ncbi:MAG TPA: hypothetical protein IAB65_06380 [Candidatus Onthocola stercorigallinarum]|nr:hypothetical protein [Candidatus Onthocola stercorigallinarum]